MTSRETQPSGSRNRRVRLNVLRNPALIAGCGGLVGGCASPGSDHDPGRHVDWFRPVLTTIAAPTHSASASSIPASTARPRAAAAATEWHQEMLHLLNLHRSAAQLPELRLCAALTRAAHDYSVVLRDWGDIAHTGPDGSEVPDRVEAAGYTGWTHLGENLASGQLSVGEVMRGWMNSPGHRANILNADFLEVGFGRSDRGSINVEPYWVQKFGTSGRC